MANIEAVKAAKLINLIQKIPNFQDMWLRHGNDGLLLIGKNPLDAEFYFDFSSENFVPLENRPQLQPEHKKVAAPPEIINGRATGRNSIVLNGVERNYQSQKQLLRGTILYFASLDENFLERLSQEKPRSRRLVARKKSMLFDNVSLTNNCSEELLHGWWWNTNNSKQQAEKWIRLMARISGHDWADNIQINWNL